MSRDFLELGREADRLNRGLTEDYSPSVGYAKRVERIVAMCCGIRVDEFWSRRKFKRLSDARHILWAILHQPHGIRSTTWLARRYGMADHSTICHGLRRMKYNKELVARQHRIIYILVEELEKEAFGREFVEATKKTEEIHDAPG